MGLVWSEGKACAWLRSFWWTSEHGGMQHSFAIVFVLASRNLCISLLLQCGILCWSATYSPKDVWSRMLSNIKAKHVFLFVHWGFNYNCHEWHRYWCCSSCKFEAVHWGGAPLRGVGHSPTSTSTSHWPGRWGEGYLGAELGMVRQGATSCANCLWKMALARVRGRPAVGGKGDVLEGGIKHSQLGVRSTLANSVLGSVSFRLHIPCEGVVSLFCVRVSHLGWAHHMSFHGPGNPWTSWLQQ